MAKDPNEKNVAGGGAAAGVLHLPCSCADIKLLVIALLFVCSIATLLQFFPSRYALPSPSDLRSCLSSKLAAAPSPSETPPPIIAPVQTLTTASPSPPPPPPTLPSLQTQETTTISGGGVIKRTFNPIGSAAYLFIQMGAYRGGDNTFAVVGLASKPLHVFAKPRFLCEWVDAADNRTTLARSYKILPDWGYGRVYTVVVVNCTFPRPVLAGGRLILRATTGAADAADEQRFVALDEPPGAANLTKFTAPPRYDYLYCGSPLYGNLSPQRVREWLAYHARIFGDRAHFVIYDAGGVHPAVMAVLRPWIDKGVVTLQDVRDQERFDGYYHNQFLVVNDCLHRYRFDAKWMFFFDLDEFLYLKPPTTLHSLLRELSAYNQFTIEQMPMSGKICPSSEDTNGMWGFEKLVYRDVKRGVRRDRKYAIQPRHAYATGVHMSQNVAGRTLHKTERRIMYYHYHGTISERREPCRVFANESEVVVDRVPYVRDETLRGIAGTVKRFELKAIGGRLRRTRQ